MSEAKQCIMAAKAKECIDLLKKCASGDKECIEQFKKLKGEYAQGMTFQESKEEINKFLTTNQITPFIVSGKKSDEIIGEWHKSLLATNTSEAQLIVNNENLTAIFMSLVEYVIRPDSDKFSGDPATMKTSSAWFPPRPTGAERVFSDLPFDIRPTKRVMTGGGSQRKTRSYVNKMRYLDSLNTYYNMVGGAVEPFNCSDQLKVMYNDITNNLQSHGKQVEVSDNRIIENMLNKFSNLETKLAQIQENINKLSSVHGSNVSGVLHVEKDKLKLESKYLSNQGKSITSIIRSLLESTDNISDNNQRTLTNARLQFPQYTVTY